MEYFLTIQDIVKITGKSRNAINKFIKKGIIKSRKSLKTGACEVEKKELERFLGYTIEWPAAGVSGNEEISSDRGTGEIASNEILKRTIREILEEEMKLHKPEELFYRLEKLEETVENLLEKREFSYEKLHEIFIDKELPDNIKQVLMDNAENIRILQKEKESLLNTLKKLDEENRSLKSQIDKNNRYADSIGTTLLENAENLQILQREVETLRKEKEGLMREMERVKCNAEEEKKMMLQGLNTRIKEISKPWWRNF